MATLFDVRKTKKDFSALVQVKSSEEHDYKEELRVVGRLVQRFYQNRGQSYGKQNPFSFTREKLHGLTNSFSFNVEYNAQSLASVSIRYADVRADTSEPQTRDWRNLTKFYIKTYFVNFRIQKETKEHRLPQVRNLFVTYAAQLKGSRLY